MRRLPPRLSEALVLRNPSMLDYKTLTMHDMPEVVVEIVEDPDPEGPFGAKEVGQGPLLPIMPAIANAVYDWCTYRRSAHHPFKGAEGAEQEGCRARCPYRARGFP